MCSNLVLHASGIACIVFPPRDFRFCIVEGSARCCRSPHWMYLTAVHFVGIRDERFRPPHRFAISWTLAFLELPLRRPLVLPYVFLLLARYVHITVDPASVPVQQPGRCVERFALSPYGWQSLLHPCWLTMLLRRILEDVSIRPACHTVFLNAVIACSLFFLIMTLFLPQDSTLLHTMPSGNLPVPLSRWCA